MTEKLHGPAMSKGPTQVFIRDEQLLAKLDEIKEQLDDLYEGQEAIKDQLRELSAALDLLSDEEDPDDMPYWKD